MAHCKRTRSTLTRIMIVDIYVAYTHASNDKGVATVFDKHVLDAKLLYQIHETKLSSKVIVLTLLSFI